MRSEGRASSWPLHSRMSPSGWSLSAASGRTGSRAWTATCSRCRKRRRSVPAETNIIAEPGTRTIVMVRSFDTPRAIVFEAWTKPEHVACWWDPGGSPLPVCEIDLRPNGAFRWVNRGPDGKDHPFSGTYREIAAPERLVFTSSASLVTLIFTEDAGTTK